MHRFTTWLLAVIFAVPCWAQSNYADWAAAGKPDFTLPAVAAPPAILGGLTVFADLASFQAATGGGFTVETFDGGFTGPGAVNTCIEPVNSASNDVCFTPGDLIPGFGVTSSGGGGVVVLGDGFIGQPTAVIGANTFAETTITTFNPPILAVALDVFSGSPAAGDVTVTAFDAGAVMIGSVTVTTGATNVSEFVGFTSATPVASIDVAAANGGGELMDNLQFGNPGQPMPEPAEVPTLSGPSLWLLAVLLLAVAGMALFRKYRTG